MKNAQQTYSYRNAASALMLANTPLFLLRKLKADSLTMELARTLSDDEIISELMAAVRDKPTDIDEAVRPYVYLVALSFKGNASSLKRAVDLDAPYAEWFKYLANYLSQSLFPTSRQTVSLLLPTVSMPNEIHQPSTSRVERKTVSISSPKLKMGIDSRTSSSAVSTVTSVKMPKGK